LAQTGEKIMTFYSILNTKLVGGLLLTANERALTGVYFADQAHAPAIGTQWAKDPVHGVIREAREQIESYLAGERTVFSLPLVYDGTALQQEVWRQIARIPFGETITYSELAQWAGAAEAVRAVGAATGRNPLSIVIPCHRVVAKGGALCGYAGGLERKARLLELEQVARSEVREDTVRGHMGQGSFTFSPWKQGALL
jgi:methylated-DNA-[protein]-cysteine S-methyltransferase